MRKSSVVGLLVLILSLVAGLSAQTPQGRIVGRVTDASGAVIANAKITITETQTGVARVLQTNDAGDYVAPNLPPGLYSVAVESAGFQKTVRSAVRLEVATAIRLDFNMKPGGVAEVLEVTGEQPLIDTVTDTLGGTITNKSINELPLQGRDFQNLLALRPGVQRYPGGGMLSITSNGNRTTDNNFMIDGTDGNDIYYGDTVVNGAGVMGTPATHLPLDAIQEFNTQENQGAEFGWKPGVVVNIGVKSGTNALHGTGYYFHRNSALDARNYFSRPPMNPSALLMHQFGSSLGGAIIKDKWFFFGNYEGTRHKVGNPWVAESPVTTSLIGRESQLPEGWYPEDYSIADAKAICMEAGTCNPLSLKIADLFLPNPGFTAKASDPAGINFDFVNKNREDNFVIKSDYHINSRNVLSGRYIYGNSHQVEEDTSPLRPEFMSYADTKVGVAGLTLTTTPNSRWVNEARFGFNRMWQHIDTVDSAMGTAQNPWGIDTGITDPRIHGMPRIDIAPFDYFGGNYNWPLFTIPNRTLQFADNVSYVRGSHNIAFGGEFRYGLSDNYRARYGKGRVRFSSLLNFLEGYPRSSAGNLLVGDTHRWVTMPAMGGFIKDDWRINRKLNFSFGLRYDLTMVIRDSHDQLANFVPNAGVVQVGKGIDAPYQTNKTNFSPRLGLAYDLFGNGSTVLRAGAAMIYEQPTMRLFIDRSGLNTNPSGIAGVQPGTGDIKVISRSLRRAGINWTGTGPIFNTDPSLAACDYDPETGDGTACDILGVNRDLKTPRVFSWNANVQQQLGKSTALQIAYVGNRGLKLFNHRDINQVDPNLDDGSEQYGRPFVQNCLNGSGSPCFPWMGFVNMVENLGSSTYQSLQTTVTTRNWHGLDVLAGYTWAHAIDYGTSDRSGYPQDSWNFAAEKGNGDYDIRHRFTLSMTYNLPKFQAPLQLGEGWQLTSIVTLEGGMPYTMYDSYNDVSLTYEGLDRWNLYGPASAFHWSVDTPIPWYPDASANPQCAAVMSANNIEDAGLGCYAVPGAVIVPPGWGKFGTMGRNIFRGPSFRNWDMSFTKTFKMNERTKLQLRGEFFNVLNHANFDVGTLNYDLGYPELGLGTVTATPDVAVANPVIGSGGSRHIQIGAKIIW